MTSQKYKKISSLLSFPGIPNPDAVFPVSYLGSTYKVRIGDISGSVDKNSLGLGNVDNTSDANKPISNQTQAALNSKANSSHNHQISDISNLSTYIQDFVNQQFSLLPVTSAVQQLLDGKAPISHTHDYTTIVGLQSALNAKADITHTHPLTSHTHSKTEVGLGNVDNTSDINKPISNPQKAYVDSAIANVTAGTGPHTHAIADVGGLQIKLDELLTLLQNNRAAVDANLIDAVSTLNTRINNIIASGGGVTGIVDVPGLQTELDRITNLITSIDNRVTNNVEPTIQSLRDDFTAYTTHANSTFMTENDLSPINQKLVSLRTDVDSILINGGGGSGSGINDYTDVPGLTEQLNLKADQTSLDTLETTVTGLINDKADLAALNNLDTVVTNLINDKADLAALNNLDTVVTNLINDKADLAALNSIGDEVQSIFPVLDAKAELVHTHAIEDTSGLRSELDDLSNRISVIVGGGGSGVTGIQDVPGLVSALNSKLDITSYSSSIGNYVLKTDYLQAVSDLNGSLNNKAAYSHLHSISQISGLDIALDSKVDDSQLSNYYSKTEIDSKDGVLQSSINNKSDLGHDHSINEVIGLNDVLADRASINHTHTKADIGLANVDNTSDANKPISTATQNALNLYVPLSTKGLINGVASLDATGKIPSSQLPSYVDDIEEFANLASFPATGETGKIYVAIDSNYTYRWGGVSYIAIAIAGSGAVSSVNSKTGIVVLTKDDIGLSNVNNTSDLDKPISNAVQTSLDSKAALSHTHSYTKADVGLSNVDNTSDANKPVSTAVQTALNAKINSGEKGSINGVATLDGTGKIPSSQLPAYVDDVLEYATTSAFPATGTSGVIYVATDTNSVYRWSGSVYINLSSGSGGVTSVNSKTGVVTLTNADVGLGNVDNTSDLNKPISTAVQTALTGKANTSHIHAISDISNLQSTLDGKSAIGHTHTKADVGLNNVDNTSDLAKPISTATKNYVDTAIAGVSGGGGGSGSAIIHNTTTRYEALSSAGYKVHCVSSANIYSGLSWTRSGTNLTINHTAHGRAIGDRVIIKDTNVLVLNALITNITTDSYTVDCSDSGDVSGTIGKYTCGFKFAHNSEVAGALTGGVLSAPLNCDIQLLSMRIHTKANSRAGSTYDLTIPTSTYSPAGGNTSADDVYVPLTLIRADADTMTAVGNTIAMNQTGSYSIFRYGNLGNVAQGQLMLLQF